MMIISASADPDPMQRQSSAIDLNLTSETENGEAQESAFGIFEDADNGIVHSLTKQSLMNGYTRYTVQYTVPAGLTVSVFSPGENTIFFYEYGSIVTSEELITLRFDISDDDQAAIHYIGTATGKMKSYPWTAGDLTPITTAVPEGGVTSFTDEAFANGSKLTMLYLPGSLEELIGNKHLQIT